MNRYPIYIISKGRWSRRQTVKLMQLLGVDFYVVVEPQEYEKYCEVIPKKYVLSLPWGNLGQGSIPARNWVWQHSRDRGYARHWILDDNIDSIYRLNNNKKLVCTTPAPFRAAEDFVDRYVNVAIAGFNYNAFVQKNTCLTPYRLNTRIYSCILLSNEIDYEWRGRYNEDTDLSLRVLKDGYCTVLFNAFVANKETTMRATGGNTDELYNQGDERKEFAESLQRQHPDLVTVDRRFGRWHHVVDYSGFKNRKLIREEGREIPEGINNYGMVVRRYDEKMHITKILNKRGIKTVD